MTRQNAIAVAVQRVDDTGWTFSVLRRGYKYDVQLMSYGPRNGWACAEMIGPGNVHNFRPREVDDSAPVNKQ